MTGISSGAVTLLAGFVNSKTLDLSRVSPFLAEPPAPSQLLLHPSQQALLTESCLDLLSLEKLRTRRHVDWRSSSESPGEANIKSQFLPHGLPEVLKGKCLGNEAMYDMLIKYVDD